MSNRKYSLVLGVDARTLGQLALVLPTWARHKPSLFNRPVIVFHDRDLSRHFAAEALRPFARNLLLYEWPPAPGVEFAADPHWRRGNPQRTKMLSGFVHVAAAVVETRYWLKLDCDVVATGNDRWADDAWFEDDPGIVAHRWGYTKPANQMQTLDAWVWANKEKLPELMAHPSLCLAPSSPESSALPHPRVISWCGFFRTDMTRAAAEAAARTCGRCQIPVPSQDGYLWYWATRTGETVVRENMKSSWEHWNTEQNIRAAVERVLA